MLVDLGSLSGSYVIHAPVDTVVLINGDELAVGAFRLTFHHATAMTMAVDLLSFPGRYPPHPRLFDVLV